MAQSVIIIGAGLAGLAAGVYAQLNGYRSHIFEHHSQPGGVAATWRRGDYLVEGGIHFLMGHRPGQALYEFYRELGAAEPGSTVDMEVYGDFVDEASGRRLLVTGDLLRLAADLKRGSPGEARVIDELIGGAQAFAAANAFDMGMADPPELAGPFAPLKQLWGMRGVLRYMTPRFSQPIGDYTRTIGDPWLATVINNLFMPEVPVWFVFMILALLSQKQMGLLVGGSQGFVKPIVRRYCDLGGEITYNATVVEILTEGSRAVGVRLADGREQRADVVISAADGYSTIFEMLGGRFADDKIRARYRDWGLIRPAMMFSFGVARAFPDDPHLRAFILRDPIMACGKPISGLMLRICNYTPQFAPLGKTLIQASFETEWEPWRALRDDLPRYEAEKARLAAEVLARLEVYYPGLAGQVELTDVATPYTTWRYTRNRAGAYEGWLPTPRAIMTTLPRGLPGLNNFIMAGQWVVPGGGVPTSLASGRDAVRILCRRDGKKFTHTAG